MRNKFTLMLAAAVVVFAGFLSTITLEAAPRKVVIEDHTGAWCGFCPYGMEAFIDLKEQYGDSFIEVAVHNGDAMTISSYQSPLAQEMGVTGYPNGTVNRVSFSGKKALHPTATQNNTPWAAATMSLINTEVPVGVTLEVDYDKETGDYTATITAVVESSVNGQLAFNLWALEDYMKGTGSQWDQVNYLSSQGSAPNPNSIFYNYPPKITGYEHNSVFRGATGGLIGDTDGFPTGTTTPAGTYTKVYTGNVSDLNVENSLNAYFVAVVHNQATKEIVNADEFGKPDYTTETAAPTLTIANTDYYKLVPDNESGTHNITVKSNISSESEYKLFISPTSSIPEGWDVSAENVMLPANGSGTFELNVNPNGNAGFAYIVVRAFAQVPGTKNLVSEQAVFTLSATTERMLFGNADSYSGITNLYLENSPTYENGATSPISLAQLLQLEPNLGSMLKTAFVTVDEGKTGLAAQVSASGLTAIQNLLDAGVNLYISAPADLRIYGNNIQNFPPTAAATDFFKNTLGVDFGLNVGLVNQQTNQYIVLPVTGVSGDPISNGLSTSVNTQGVYRGIQSVPSMSLNGNSSATAFLEAPSTEPWNANNNKLAIKLDNNTNGQRLIFSALPFDAINSSAQANLMNNMLIWLEGGTIQGAGPSISLNVSQVKFGEVEVEETASETVQISNKGDEKLSITEINLLKGTNFEVKAGSLPITIDPGQTVNLTIEFTPTDKQNYTDEITFVSNDSENSETVLPVQGTGKLITSVPGQILNVFSMNVVPNPVTDNSVVNFNVKEGSSNVKLVLIDATGKVVSNLYDNVASGNQKVDLNASQLSSGSYYINADVDGITTQLPVVITK